MYLDTETKALIRKISTLEVWELEKLIVMIDNDEEMPADMKPVYIDLCSCAINTRKQVETEMQDKWQNMTTG